jgi:hypothetical protein
MEDCMKKGFSIVFILVITSVAVFSAEQNYNLKVINNDSTMGVLVLQFEIVDGPMRGEKIHFYAVSELYKAVFERYLKPTSRVIARFDIDEQFRLWPSQIISIDGKAIDTLFR